MSCFLENKMVSVERIKQFTVIPSEAEWKKKDILPPLNWPTHGNVELKNLQVSYDLLFSSFAVILAPNTLIYILLYLVTKSFLWQCDKCWILKFDKKT